MHATHGAERAGTLPSCGSAQDVWSQLVPKLTSSGGHRSRAHGELVSPPARHRPRPIRSAHAVAGCIRCRRVGSLAHRQYCGGVRRAFAGSSAVGRGEGAAAAQPDDGAAWVVRGVTSNERYLKRREHDELVALQQPLGRPGSTRAALIPITKSEAWWELAQDERRRIFEESSRHLATSLEYVPAVAPPPASWARPRRASIS
jgi:hypothetical protein